METYLAPRFYVLYCRRESKGHMNPGWLRSKDSALAVAAIALCAVGVLCQFALSPALASGTAGSKRALVRTHRAIRFEGRIEDISLGWWTVSGHRVRVPSRLAFSGSTWEVGDWVMVHAERQRDGELEAIALVADVDDTTRLPTETILPMPRAVPAIGWWTVPDTAFVFPAASADGAVVEFEGSVLALPAGGVGGDWLVDDVRVIVGEGAKIMGTPVLGVDVEVTGLSEGERNLWAQEIRVVSPDQEPVLLYGLITDVASVAKDGVLTLRARSDKGIALPISVQVDERTFFDESRGRADVDMWAEVRVVPQADGTLWAQYVRVIRH